MLEVRTTSTMGKKSSLKLYKLMLLQAHGLSLSVGSVVVVAITATLAAIGSASIPNSALVSMITILQVHSIYNPLHSSVKCCYMLLCFFSTDTFVNYGMKFS